MLPEWLLHYDLALVDSLFDVMADLNLTLKDWRRTKLEPAKLRQGMFFALEVLRQRTLDKAHASRGGSEGTSSAAVAAPSSGDGANSAAAAASSEEGASSSVHSTMGALSTHPLRSI